jgi:hypothetical protein
MTSSFSKLALTSCAVLILNANVAIALPAGAEKLLKILDTLIALDPQAKRIDITMGSAESAAAAEAKGYRERFGCEESPFNLNESLDALNFLQQNESLIQRLGTDKRDIAEARNYLDRFRINYFK